MTILNGGETKPKGKVRFLNNSGELITEIKVEIAITQQQVETGMMLRESNSDENGMLFILEFESEESVWMKNTKITLDIVFASKAKKIEKIYRNTEPLDETILPSIKPVKYIVEVNAGFTEKYGILEGNYIDWEKC